MVLSLISKDRTETRPLSNKASSLLKAYYAGLTPVTEAEAAHANRLFGMIRSKDQFIVCDCLHVDLGPRCDDASELAESSPLRAAALPGVLRALPHPPNLRHCRLCVFSQRKSELGSNVIPRTEPADEDNLAVFGNYHVSRGPRRDNVRSSAVRRLPSISQVLFSVIEAAQLNRFGKGEQTASHATAAFVNSRKLSLVSGFSLQNALVTGDRKDEKQGIRRIMDLKASIADKEQWPEECRPQGYWCGVVDGYAPAPSRDRYDVKVNGWTNAQYLESRPHVFGGFTEDGARHPYVAIFGYALPDENAEKALGLRSFMQPCYSKDCWFPVDSDYERKTLRELINFKNQNPALQIDIHKPLFNVPVSADRKIYCKPDFVLEFTRGDMRHQLAIETMGYTDPAYEERKERTHRLMLNHYGGLVQHCFVPTRNTELTRRFVHHLEAFVKDGKQPDYATLRSC